MSELLDIIISAVDNASDVIDGIGNTAQDTADAIRDSFSGDSFDEMTSALEEANAEVERLEEELAAIYMGDIEGDAEAVEAALAAAQEEAKQLADALKEAGENGDGLEDSVDSIESLMAFQEISGVVNQLADAMWEVTDKAGMVQDSWDRLGLAAEGAGINMDGMKTAVSELSEETGRAGGSIRESFIAMTSAGITDMETMKTVFKGASAQAFILGTDVDSLANKFSGMAMKSTLSERTLKGTGVTMQELGEAMGLQGATIDEVKQKWEELDVNQRAAALGMAASMNEGKDANDAYKNSWEGLQAQIDIAKGKLEVLVGKVFLPVVIPILQTAGRVLDWLGDTLSGVMEGPFGTFISVVGSAGGALLLALAGITAVTTALPFLTTTLWPAIAASWALLAPWLPWIALGAAIVYIIYEIGKAFGWWTDVGSMIDAIWAGLQRLWDAFINHPDVQAALKAISDALAWIWSGLQQAGQAVLDFFGINTSGNFDIVRALIEGIGKAWDVISLPIKSVIAAIQILAGAFSSFYSGTLVPFGDFLSGIFGPVWEWIMGVIQQITPFVTQLSDAFTAFQEGQLDLPGIIWAVLNFIGNAYLTVFTNILTGLGNFAMGILSGALTAGSNLVTGVVTWISQLPGKVLNYLNSVKLQIMVQMSYWVTLAKVKIASFVNGIVTWLRQLPGKVYSALVGVVSRIVSAGQQWVNSAKQKARELVNGAVNTLSELPGKIASALGGVADAIVAPFRRAYDDAKKLWDQISSMASSLTGAAGGDMPAAAGGETLSTITGNNTGTYTIEADNSPIVIEDNIKLTLDLQNVPSNISSDGLIEALRDKNVLSAIANNRDFQDLDARVKQRISLKYGRSRGL